MFDQVENIEQAILKKRVKIEEITLIISRPLPQNASIQHRRNLIEQKLHLEKVVSELETELRLEQYRRADRTFRLEDINQNLITPKTLELAEEMQERSRQAENRVSFESAKSGNPASFAPPYFDFQERLADEWAGRLFKAYCLAWVEQNRTVLPALIRAVSNRPINELLGVRTSSVEDYITSRAQRISQPLNPFVLHDWRIRMERLATRWRNRLEAEATKSMYCIGRNVPYSIPDFKNFESPALDGGVEESASKNSTLDVNDMKHSAGRHRKIDRSFVGLAGRLWKKAKAESSRVTEQQLALIAAELDANKYVPPTDYLENGYSKKLKEYNSKNSNSKLGAALTWSQLVSSGDKDHLRGMRRRLSRCSMELKN